MVEKIDTRMVPLNTPLSEGLIRRFHEPLPGFEKSYEESITGSESVTPEQLLFIGEKHETQNTRMPFLASLSMGTKKFSRSVITSLAAAQINLARLSDESWGTATADMTAIVQILSESKCRVVTVSPELIMPRNEVQASSLLAPSGAYLTWMQMLGEEASGDN